MTTTPRAAVTLRGCLFAVVLCTATLTACTSSGSSSTSGSSGATNPAATTSTGTSAGTSTAAASGSSATSGSAAGKPVATETIQGSHLTYVIDIWARETSHSCAAAVTGSKLLALVRGKPCTVTRFIGTTKASGKAIGVSEATLTFGGSAKTAAHTATQATVLMTSSADDGIVDLLHDGKRLPSGPTQVPSTAARNAINSGSSVRAVQTWYLSGRTPDNDPQLNETVEDLSTI